MITEEFRLPSLGKMYKKNFDPIVKLRSMTVADEMKRLSASINEYKAMAEIIDSCLLTKLPISAYDLYMCDYVYLLQKLRVVTYGSDYKMSVICPSCGQIETVSVNLDELEVQEFDPSDFETLITLPSGMVVQLKLQTPRDLDYINSKAKDLMKKFPENGDMTLLLTLESLIESIDGSPINHMTILESLKKMPMNDMNVLVKKAQKLQQKVGIDMNLTLECPNCKSSVNTTFRYTSEFFGPEVD